MNVIYCAYLDQEGEQDVAPQPDLSEAITIFRTFNWQNEQPDSAVKLLIFRGVNDETPFCTLFTFFDHRWSAHISIRQRRRFLGPLFKRSRFCALDELDAAEVESFLTLLFTTESEDFMQKLKSQFGDKCQQ